MTFRTVGNYISATYNPLASNITTGVNTAQTNGVFSVQEQAQAIQNQQWVTDPNFRSTTLLLQADNRANGSQNNTFLDSSANNFAITRNGNTTQGTFTPFSTQPGLWSVYLNGSSSLRDTSTSSVYHITGNFTVEGWYWFDSAGVVGDLFGIEEDTTGWAAVQVQINTNSTLTLNIATGAGSWAVNATSTATVNFGTWNHVAVTRSGSSINLWLNGVSIITATNGSSLMTTGSFTIIGGRNAGGYMTGYVSNFRFVNGSALYTAAFTPSATPFTTTSQGASAAQVELLACQNNRFLDNSDNAFTLTPTGTPSVQSFSPFPPQFQWTPSVIGGSGFFDGTGDYLQLPTAINSQIGALAGKQRTFEFWINTTEIAAITAFNMSILGNFQAVPVNGRYAITLLGSSTTSPQNVNFAWTTSTSTVASVTTTATLNQKSWNHIAITIDATTASSTTIVIYLNGVGQTFTGQNLSSQTVDPGYEFWLGDNRDGTQTYRGFMGGFKISTGIQRVSNFTPPTSPFISDANTILLLNFTNAGIYDGTMENNLETVGNASVSTSVVKYGSGSIAFDGAGDYLTSPASPNYNFGSGDFTIECWLFPTSHPAFVYLIGQTNAADFAPVLCLLSSGRPGIAATSASGSWAVNATSTTTLTLNAWTHVAYVRFGNKWSVYINGVETVLAASTAVTVYNSTDPLGIGGEATAPLNYPYFGFIDDLRITKFARYTANFTPPTVALPRQ